MADAEGLALLHKQMEFSGCKIALLCDDKLLTILRDDFPTIPWPNIEQDRGAARGQVAQQDAQVGARTRVHAGGRLVQEEDFGGVDEGAGQTQALLLAAGEDPGGRARHLIEVDQPEHLEGASAGGVGVHTLGGSEGQEDLGAGQGVPGAEGIKHPAHGAVDLARLGHRVQARHPDRPGVRGQERRQHEQQGGLACTVGADQAGDGATGHRHVQLAHRRSLPEEAGELGDFNAHGRRVRRWSGLVGRNSGPPHFDQNFRNDAAPGHL